MARPNIYAGGYEYDDTDAPGFRKGLRRVGREAGGVDISVNALELPEGEHLCPYHYEYEEEWLIVLDGEVDVRTPSGTERFTAGDVMAFPKGPEGAHQVTGRSSRAAKIVMFSSAREPAVIVYPDSDKIGVWPGRDADNVILRRADGQFPYFDGERA